MGKRERRIKEELKLRVDEIQFSRVVRIRLRDKVMFEQRLKEIRSRNPQEPILLDQIFYFGKIIFKVQLH